LQYGDLKLWENKKDCNSYIILFVDIKKREPVIDFEKKKRLRDKPHNLDTDNI